VVPVSDGWLSCTDNRIDCPKRIRAADLADEKRRGSDRVSFFRSAWRSLRIVGMFVGAGTELLVKRPATREQRADWLHRFCARAIRKMGIQIDVVGKFPDRGAVISNHLSYLDIVVYASLHPCVFVSKAEIQSWPVVGWMTTMSGTVYVARGQGGSALKARGGMQTAFDAGLPVVFFPEGTTSNGTGLLKFHSGLLGQVMEAKTKVTAACVRYRLDEDNGPGVTVEDDVSYWGDRDMWAHVFKFLALRGVRAEVRFADAPIAFTSDSLHRKEAARQAQAAVAALRNTASEVDVYSGQQFISR
jgi:lyso-ornithine lipid O-acyltransferase